MDASMMETGGRLAVLVVDGTPAVAGGLAAHLSAAGFAPRTAVSGPAALLAAADDPPDVVVLDLHLPEMDGYELAGRLRAQAAEAGKRPFLVGVSECGTDDARRRSAAAGIDMYLAKPADPATLVGLLRRFERVLLPG